MLKSLALVFALSSAGQVPDGYVEVQRPPVVVPQPPKVTVEEQPPLVIERPPIYRVQPQPPKVVEQEPVRVPVYRPEVRVYEYPVVLPEPVYYGLPVFEPYPLFGGRAGRLEVREKYELKVRGGGFRLFGR